MKDKTRESFPLDQAYAECALVTGIDEVGRGCLAGPVVVAAVTWAPGSPQMIPELTALDDSKAINAKVRAALFKEILQHASRIRVAWISNHIVDHINILRATLHGFELVAPAYNPDVPLFIDGNQKPPSLRYAQTVVKGERALSAIAAASVIAKVCRDGLMVRLHKTMPEYGFASHMGYATAVHRKAIEANGPGPYHRKCFAPIRQLCEQALPHDEALTAEILDGEDRGTIWERFCDHYGKLSLPASRELVNHFQREGWNLLPGARDGRPFDGS